MAKRKSLADAFKRSSLVKDEGESQIHSIGIQETRNDPQPSVQPLQTRASEEVAANIEFRSERKREADTVSQVVVLARETVNTVRDLKTKLAGVAPAPLITRGAVEVVPGPKGTMIPADQPVNMTFTVSAKERYLWNLELSRLGLTGVSVLREAMNHLLDEE